MDYKNGYKVVYEVAAGGKRTFYASKTNEYPPRDEDGNIIENEMNTKLASFNDADFAGKTIYEYQGEFYVADTSAAKFDKDGKPTGTKLGTENNNFDKILVEEKPASYSRRAHKAAAPRVEEPVVEPEAEEPTVNTKEDETAVEE